MTPTDHTHLRESGRGGLETDVQKGGCPKGWGPQEVLRGQIVELMPLLCKPFPAALRMVELSCRRALGDLGGWPSAREADGSFSDRAKAVRIWD